MSEKLKFQPNVRPASATPEKEGLTRREKLLRRTLPAAALIGAIAAVGAVKIDVTGGDSKPQRIDVNSYSPQPDKSEARFLERVAAGLEKAEAVNGIDVLAEGVHLRSAPKVINETEDDQKGNIIDTVQKGEYFVVTNPLKMTTIEDNDGNIWHGAVLQIDGPSGIASPTDLARNMVWYNVSAINGLKNEDGQPYMAQYAQDANPNTPDVDTLPVTVSDKGELSVTGTTDTFVLASAYQFESRAAVNQFLTQGHYSAK